MSVSMPVAHNCGTPTPAEIAERARWLASLEPEDLACLSEITLTAVEVLFDDWRKGVSH